MTIVGEATSHARSLHIIQILFFKQPHASTPVVVTARGRPKSSFPPPRNEGARNAGCTSASAAPCAKVESTRVSSPRSRRRHPAFRTQWLERQAACHNPRCPVLSAPPLRRTDGRCHRCLSGQRRIVLPPMARAAAPGSHASKPSAFGVVVIARWRTILPDPAGQEVPCASWRSNTDRSHRIPPRVS